MKESSNYKKFFYSGWGKLRQLFNTIKKKINIKIKRRISYEKI